MVASQTITLANSIVGVSVLAMPFCFKQCGVVLATLMLMLGAVVTRTVCYFLLKAGTITKRRNYEMLAWHTFGQGGKFIVEISNIGFLIGTLVAFFVVMGDLGPEIVSEVFSVENNASLRNIIMAALSLFVALPLGLLRSIDSLSSVSTISAVFYICLVFKILSEGLGPLVTGSYLDRIEYWRPAGILQCIPIFSMSLSCQTQIFGIYESLPEPSLQKMNDIVKQAVIMCTIFYFCVGSFGYIAFCHQSFGGNILMSLSAGPTTQMIKLCFLLTVVFSVPLMVFPCRASLHSLIFRREIMHHSLHDMSTSFIPDGRLKFLTILIIGFTLFVGILIPNIELVLGLVGSTTGTVTCIIFPSIMFIRVISKQTTERLLAQIIFITGILTMVVSTYTTLYAVEQAQQAAEPLPDQIRVTEIIKDIRKEESRVSFQTPDAKLDLISFNLKKKLDELDKMKKDKDPETFDKIIIPPGLHEKSSSEKPPQLKKAEHVKTEVRDEDKPRQNQDDMERVQALPPPQPRVQAGMEELKQEGQGPVVPEISPIRPVEKKLEELQGHAKPQDEKAAAVGSKYEPQPSAVLEKDSAVEILKKLEEHQENQKKLLQEQQKILDELKEHHEQDVHRQEHESVEHPPRKEDKPPVDLEIPKKEEISQDLIDKKVEVFKQEKLIEKLSENIEKEKQNAEILEKIEEGLNKEIKLKPEPRANNVLSQEPLPSAKEKQEPVIVGETVSKLVNRVEPAPGDPIVRAAAAPQSISDQEQVRKVQSPPVQLNLKPLSFQKIAPQSQEPSKAEKAPVPPNLIDSNPKVPGGDRVAVENDKKQVPNNENQRKPLRNQNLKQVDRDI